MEPSTDLQRYEQYLATPIEAHQSRTSMGFTEETFDRLHDLAVQAVAPSPPPEFLSRLLHQRVWAPELFGHHDPVLRVRLVALRLGD